MQSGYIRADYDRPELHWQTVSDDTDLFGDGLIRLVETRATPPASRPAGLATRPIAPPRGVESTQPQGIDLQQYGRRCRIRAQAATSRSPDHRCFSHES